MLFARRLTDLLLISVIPSLISMVAMSQIVGSSMAGLAWLLLNVFSFVMFYACYILLLRRFIYDINSKELYYKIQTAAWAVTCVLAILLWLLKMGNALSSTFFYARFFEMISPEKMTEIDGELTSKHVIRTIASIIISMGINLVLIYVMYPIFSKRKEEYKKTHGIDEEEIADEEIEKINEKNYNSQTSGNEHHHRHHHGNYDEKKDERVHKHHHTIEELENIPDDAVMTKKMYKKLKRLENLDENSPFVDSKRRKNLKKAQKKGFGTKILDMWSYGFYQYYLDKIEDGASRSVLIKSFVKRKLSFFIPKLPKSKRRRRR